MGRKSTSMVLKLMIAGTTLLGFLVIFIFLNTNTASAGEVLSIIPA